MVARLRETHVAAVLCFVLDILIINPVIGEQSDPCNKYSLLSDNYRNVNSPEGSVVQEECDNFMDPGWYAFLVHNQASMIPTECTQDMSCGSPMPFHVQMIDNGTQGEGLPLGEEKDALLCGSGNDNCSLNCCMESTGIKIKRCSETLVVYYISPFQTCPRTFCTLKFGEVMSDKRRGINSNESLSCKMTPPTTMTTVSTPPTTTTASIPPTKSTVSTPPTKSTASTPPTITPYSTPPVTSYATRTLTSSANTTEATTTYQASMTVLQSVPNLHINLFSPDQTTEKPSQVTEQEEGKDGPPLCPASVPLAVLVVVVCLCLVLLVVVIVLVLIIYRRHKQKRQDLDPSAQEGQSCVQLTSRKDYRPTDDAEKAPMGCAREMIVSVSLEDTGSGEVSLEQALMPSRTVVATDGTY